MYVVIYVYLCIYVYKYILYMRARASHEIEDAAMKDERGDDVPDNESNEWEVGRGLMCSLVA